jgi:phospholipid/cholesterol/gamma-HCH transport system permease protein
VIACYKGFFASGGAKGVGEATTSSVVTSSIAILVIDYILTLFLW